MVQLDIASLTAVTHVFAQDMRTRGRGKMLLVASLLAFQGVENFAVYAAAKAYVLRSQLAHPWGLKNRPRPKTLERVTHGPKTTRDAAAESWHACEPGGPAAPIASDQRSRMCRVLVIDDDVGTREGFAMVLTGAGCTVTTADTGHGGLALARLETYDVALIDLRLPDLSGLDILQQLRASGIAMPAIIVTGFGCVRTTVGAMKLGAVDVVEKPLIGDDLIDLVRSTATQTRPSPAVPPRTTAHREPIHDARIREIIDLLEREPATSLSSHALAARFALGPSRLRHLFRQTVGVSLGRFRQERRLRLAADLLATTHQRVSEIAFRIGFRDLSSFDKAFRRHTGVSPKAYRARQSAPRQDEAPEAARD
jgi:AraC-like DNA-binding protein